MYTTLLILATALLAHAGIQQSDFTGTGHIYVLQSEDWRTATPAQKVGCLNDHGKFVAYTNGSSECGTFSRRDDYPYTLTTKQGNCTFDDSTQEQNVESHYGRTDYAWSCTSYQAEIYDELYTIDGFPYVFLCFGDIACFYDVKAIPKDNETLPLWQFRWGSQQYGITPGHIMMQLLWEKVGDLPKREGAAAVIPGPRMRIEDGQQVPLQGARLRR